MFVIMELDEEGLKEKKQQKLMRAGFEVQIQARCKEEREQALLKNEVQRESEERDRNL